jgi:large conductance mechanosensitive channel
MGIRWGLTALFLLRRDTADCWARPMEQPTIAKEFRDFIAKGNIIQLAIAFVMGVAFASVITGLTTGIISPLIGEAGGTGNLANESTQIGHSVYHWGAFLADVLNFLIVAAVLFFLIVYPLLRYQARQAAKQAAAPPTTKTCPFCQSTIAVGATRCPECTSQLPADDPATTSPATH